MAWLPGIAISAGRPRVRDAGERTEPAALHRREWDAETGLYYYRARYYDPQIGWFISEDPIGLAGGINPFVYAFNDPVNLRDPSGLYPNCYYTDHGVAWTLHCEGGDRLYVWFGYWPREALDASRIGQSAESGPRMPGGGTTMGSGAGTQNGGSRARISWGGSILTVVSPPPQTPTLAASAETVAEDLLDQSLRFELCTNRGVTNIPETLDQPGYTAWEDFSSGVGMLALIYARGKQSKGGDAIGVAGTATAGFSVFGCGAGVPVICFFNSDYRFQ